MTSSSRPGQLTAPPDATVETIAEGGTDGLLVPPIWIWLSFVGALIAAAGNIVGLLATNRIYGLETSLFADASIAQDFVSLTVVVPLTIVLGRLARHGSVKAYVCWVGCVMFTAYSYAIYAFSVHFGPLFMPWVAVLGLACYAFVGGLVTVDSSVVRNWFAARAQPVAAWTLIVVATLFTLLWLKEIVPDNLAGRPSASAADFNVPTNPVHVLDLALFLPAALASGVLLLKRRPAGYTIAPGVLVFFALTCVPILLTPIVANARGHDPAWTVAAPITMLLAATIVVLWKTLRYGSVTRNA